MSTNKSISYLLCNKGIIINLYKLHFLSSHFSFQPNKRVFHPSTFPSLQPNTHKGKLNIFHPPTFPSSYNFLSFYFSTPPTKQTLNEKEGKPFILSLCKNNFKLYFGEIILYHLKLCTNYIFHYKLSKCTLCTINYHTYLTLHSGVTFAVMFD